VLNHLQNLSFTSYYHTMSKTLVNDTDLPNSSTFQYVLADNPHTYWQIKDPESLLASVKSYCVQDKMEFNMIKAVPNGTTSGQINMERRFKPSDKWVYMFGLIFRQHADKLEGWWEKYLEWLPPPLVAGALWYADVPEGNALKEKLKGTKLGAKHYQLIQKTKPPVKNFDRTTFDTSDAQFTNKLPAAISDSNRIARLEERWAHYYVFGNKESVEAILKLSDDTKLKTLLLRLVTADVEERKAIAGDLTTPESLKNNYDLAMIVGIAVYDPNFLNIVRETVTFDA
jgi:hypothetical protein